MLLGIDTLSTAANELESEDAPRPTPEQVAALVMDRTWEIAEVARALVGAGADVHYRAPVSFSFCSKFS